MLTKRSLLPAMAMAGAALAISGCGGGSDMPDRAASPGPTMLASTASVSGGTSTPSWGGSFFSRVAAVIGNCSENADPIAIESISADTADNTEPAKL